VYSLRDGLLRDLGFAAASAEEVGVHHAQALRQVPVRAAG
jgi:hypothetical protein